MLRILGITWALALGIGFSTNTQAAEYCQPGSPAQVGYNYYVPGTPGCNGNAIGAQLYVSPRPVPPNVGHTYITYEGLMPHEFMYKHKSTYYRYWGPYSGNTTARIRYR